MDRENLSECFFCHKSSCVDCVFYDDPQFCDYCVNNLTSIENDKEEE